MPLGVCIMHKDQKTGPIGPKELEEMTREELLEHAQTMRNMLAVSLVDGKFAPIHPTIRHQAYRYGAESSQTVRNVLLMVLHHMTKQTESGGGLPLDGTPPDSFE